MTRTKYQPSKKKQRLEEFKMPDTLVLLPIDCWRNIFDFLCQDIALVAPVCKTFHELISPIINEMRKFVYDRAPTFVLSKKVFNTEGELMEDKLNEDMIQKEEYEHEDYDESDAQGAMMMDAEEGEDGEKIFPGNDSHVYEILQPVADKLGHMFKDGDIIADEHDENYGYRNGGKFIFYDSKIWTLSYDIADDYGICPPYFDLDKFCVKYFTRAIDHNATRITKLDLKNAMWSQENLDKDSEKEHTDDDDDSGKHVLEYYVRYTHGLVPFNIKYKINFQEPTELKDYVMGEAVCGNFTLG
jgi:hypothetical protein